MSNHPMKLIYFNVRGRGELIRLILHISDCKFEDKRIEFSDWPEMKPTIPAGKLPLFEVDGITVNQSVAIARYLAAKYGLAGDTELDGLRCHAYVDTLRDMTCHGAQGVINEKDAAKKAEMMKQFEEDMKRLFTNFENELNKCPKKSGHLVAGKLTYADLELYNMMFMAVDWLGIDVLKGYPLLSKLYDHVSKHPKLMPYLDSRPKTPF